MTVPRRPASWLLALAAVATVALLPPARAAADEWTFRTGVRLDAYTGAGQDGHEVLLPFGLGYDTPFWGLSARGAFGNSERDPGAGIPSGSITGFTDTTVSGYYRFTVGGTDIRFGLDLDLPTGVSKLGPGEVAAIQDEDLVTLQRFGEGFDVNPTVTVYRNFGAFGVGLGACLMTQAGAYGFADLQTATRDPMRVASYVVSGIGFLGAGAILRHGTTVRGLTTAASLWGAAGIGIAVGAGMGGLAAVTVGLVLFTLTPLQRLENRLRLGRSTTGLSIHVAGMTYAFGCLVLPALVAKNLCREVRTMFLVAPVVGIVAAFAAFVLANHHDYPPGQTAVALLCGLLALAWVARRVVRG